MIKKTVIRFAAIFVFLAGLAVFSYPTIQKEIFTYQTDRTIEKYENTIKQNAETAGEKTAGAELKRAMEDYNRRVYTEGQSGLADPFSYEEASFDLKQWNMADDVFGYLKIERMNLEVPIYLGASEENMSKGVVHLSQTSLPIGGINSNAVIAGHRGMQNAEMFRHIEVLAAGDNIVIRNPWETLTYQVTETAEIEPDEVDEVLIQEGKDMVTLLTCHPYPTDDKRYVVYCERAETEDAKNQKRGEGAETEEIKTDLKQLSVAEIEQWVRIGWCLFLISAAVGVIVSIFVNKRKERKNRRH